MRWALPVPLTTTLLLLALLAGGPPILSMPATTPTPGPGGLPPIPPGLPPYFSFGLFNSDAPTWLTGSGVPWDLRYPYLAGGVNTGNGWASWNSPPGQWATSYLQATRSAGYIPAFVYYQILQSAPYYDEYANLNDPSTMAAYYDDWKLLMQKAALDGGRIFVNIEPDLTGVMEQRVWDTTNDAATEATSVASSGQADVQGYPNTFRGFYQALAHLRDVYAPNVVLGTDISTWGAGDDVTIALRDNPAYDWAHHADLTAAYLNTLGGGFGLDFFSPSDRDSAYYQAQGSNRWWDDQDVTEPTFSTMLAWLQRILAANGRRALLWQVPDGNRRYRSEDNADGHWQDNRPEYFLNPTSGRSHLQAWANAGVVGLMFGAGAGSETHYFDSKGDGITNPAPINGNDQVAQYADDDGGYIRLGVQAYWAAGPLYLPGGGPAATPTPGPSVTRPPTQTPGGPSTTPLPSDTPPPPSGTPLPTQTPGGPSATPIPSATPGGPSPTPCTLSFGDVHPADYFYTPVQYLACHGVISGYADGTFRPFANTTRGQMVKIVVLGFARPIVTPPGGAYTFADVPPAHPFFAVIETAAAGNSVSGYACGGPGEPCDAQSRPYFRPYGNVTRGQLSKIDVVAAGWALLTPASPAFADVLPGTAFYPFVETAACHGIISGYACGGAGEPCDGQQRPYFRQYNNAVRGQIAKIVYLSIGNTGGCPPAGGGSP